MARQPRVPSVVACYLLIAIVHLCSCYANYVQYMLENEKICSLIDKQHTHYLRNATAAIVTSHHMFDRWWNVNTDRKCQYTFKTTNGDGLFVVIHKMFFRRNGTQCLDYVRFKRTDGYYTNKICGEIDRNQTKYPISIKDISQSDKEVPLFLHDNTYDTFAEFDIGKPPIGVEMKTEIFISKEKVSDGQTLDLKIIYTPYKDCKKVNIMKYASVGRNSCIRLDYFCDEIHNCPYRICFDEDKCPSIVTDRFPKDDTATKVTVGAVTTMILCFIIFVMCLWICKKSHKLCWSSDCAGPNVCSRPNSLPQDADGGAGSNRTVPTAPMLEVAVSSPVADKDLPPSYDSLFPEQSNPARS